MRHTINGITRGPEESMQAWKSRVKRAEVLQEIDDTNSVEDLKALLTKWVHNGTIIARVPPPWEK